MSKKKIDIVLCVSQDDGNSAVSKELLAQLDAIRVKSQEMSTRLNDLGVAGDKLVNNAKKRIELQGKLLSGAGDLATACATVVTNVATVFGTSSEGLNKALDKIKTVAETFKSTMEVIKTSREVLEYLRDYGASANAISGKGKAAGEATIAIAGAAKPAATEARLADKLEEAGIAAQGLSMMLKDVAAKMRAGAVLAAPYAAVAVATVGLYEVVVHVLGWMGAIDASSASLLECYQGWQEAAEAAAKSTKEIAVQEEIRKARAEQRKERAEHESAALDERYKMVDANRKYIETLGIGLEKNVPLQKFDEAAIEEQQQRAEWSRRTAAAQHDKYEVNIVPTSLEAEKTHEEEKPSWWERGWYSMKRALMESALTQMGGYELGDEVEKEDPMRKYAEAGATQIRMLPAVPDYTTTIKDYERLEQLQTQGLQTKQKEYDVLRQTSKELTAQVARSEQLVKQAQTRVELEKNRAESSVANFARLDSKAREKIVSIAEKYKQTGQLSIEDAKELDKYGMAHELTDKAFAANATGDERAALDILGVFKGLDEAKQAEKRASEEVVKAKVEEAKAGKDMASLYERIVSKAADLHHTSVAISELKEKQSKSNVDRSGLAAADIAKDGAHESASVPHSAVDFEKAFDSLLKNELVPAILGTVNRAIAKLNNAT
jgi:hypothetical protein